jgi:transcriptional regulator with XRE-family HTH domain
MPLDQWRIDNDITYVDLSEALGVSRQYAEKVCKQGAASAAKLYRIVKMTGLRLEDLMTKKDLEKLEEDGFDIPLIGKSFVDVDKLSL